ncbi:hypothetical protein C8J57DRAFT_1439966 [Mycena rebaudengoi]|nr:hypothetical protein C8J57DRAFT_1439966 [Mycena rebaudengoi]
MVLPPLFGHEQGRYRVHASTVGKELARVLNVPFISLDAVFWKPGWMHGWVGKALADAKDGWVVDGSYTSKIGLDPPLALYFPRLMIRTFLGILGIAAPCSPGFPDMVSKTFFSKDSILWWCLTHHRTVRNDRKWR